jgi:hypothetical protein
MANNRLIWHGLAELRAELRRLPAELRDEGADIVRAAGTATKELTVANYPEVTGNLKRGVTMSEETSPYGIIVTVTSRAHHAHLFERGTVRQPPAPPEKRLGTHAARQRRKMYKALAALLERHGLEVRGVAA